MKDSMMKKVRLISVYILIVLFDIFEFIYRIIANLMFQFKKGKYVYDEIVGIEYYIDYIIDEENKSFYSSDSFKDIVNENFVVLDNKDFKKIISVMKNNKILKSNKFLFKFEITKFYELEEIDGGNSYKIIKIYFKDGKKREIIAYKESKNIDNLINYLKSLENVEKL